MPRNKTTLKDAWVNWCLQLCCTPEYQIVGTRKLVRNQELILTGEQILDNSLQLTDVTYAEGPAKLRLLRKFYLNEESMSRAKARMDECVEKNKHDSASFILQNETKKGFTTQDWCMLGGVVTYWPKRKGVEAHFTIEVYYRITEAAKKFVGDLIFFRDVLWQELDLYRLPVHTVTLRMSNVNISKSFSAIPLAHAQKPIAFLKQVKEHDPMQFKWLVKWTLRLYYGEGTAVNFRQLERVQERLEIPEEKAKRLYKYLKKEEQHLE